MFAFSFCVTAKRKKRDISFENEEGLKGNARNCLYSEKVECLHGNIGGFKTHGGSRAHRATADSHRSRRSAPRHDAAPFPKLFMFAFSFCITAKRKKRDKISENEQMQDAKNFIYKISVYVYVFRCSCNNRQTLPIDIYQRTAAELPSIMVNLLLGKISLNKVLRSEENTGISSSMTNFMRTTSP